LRVWGVSDLLRGRKEYLEENSCVQSIGGGKKKPFFQKGRWVGWGEIVRIEGFLTLGKKTSKKKGDLHSRKKNQTSVTKG